MKSFWRLTRALLAGAALVVPAAAYSQAERPLQQQPARGPADERLKALYEGYYAWQLKESGTVENERGESKPADYLEHVDPATQERRASHLKGLLAQLNAIPAAQLSAEEKINADVLRTVLENSIADAKFREWEMPFNSDSSFWT
jgi:uncharacterized protein (DUF885 family)